MKIGNMELDLTKEEVEFIKLVHPIFDINMSIEDAGKKVFGVTRKTAYKYWNNMVKKYPMLETTRQAWLEQHHKDRISLKNMWRVGLFEGLDEDDTIQGKKIVWKCI